MTYVNPNDKILLKAGYEIKDVEAKLPNLNNNLIREARKIEYKKQADPLFIAYQAYKELGETEKAEEAKAQWLAKRVEIDRKFPYMVE